MTGDAVNVAARLEQAAEPGEILIGEATYRLVRDAVDVEPVEPLELKGKARAGAGVSPARRRPGRRAPLGASTRRWSAANASSPLAAEAFERSTGRAGCHLFTVSGRPGSGKSRLDDEFLARIATGRRCCVGAACPTATASPTGPSSRSSGRRPASTSATPAEAPREARRPASATSRTPAIAERIARVLGLDRPPTPRPPARNCSGRPQTARVDRQATRPLVVVVDDIHWAEPTLLDLLEHVADWSRDAPILLLCLAPAGAARRAAGVGRRQAQRDLAAPRAADRGGRRPDRGPPRRRAPAGADPVPGRLEAAEGNPLFVEEILGMLIDDGLLVREGGAGSPPATSSDPRPADDPGAARGAARSARTGERAVARARLGRSARSSRPARSTELSPDPERGRCPEHLLSLVRKELIRPGRRRARRVEDAFRFRHMLIRDAAYDALPKERGPTSTSASPAGWSGRLGDRLARVRGDRRLPPRAGPSLPDGASSG